MTSDVNHLINKWHDLRLTSEASYQAFSGQITSPICPHCGSGEETANIYFYHVQGGQRNVGVILATAMMSKMFSRTV